MVSSKSPALLIIGYPQEQDGHVRDVLRGMGVPFVVSTGLFHREAQEWNVFV